MVIGFLILGVYVGAASAVATLIAGGSLMAAFTAYMKFGILGTVLTIAGYCAIVGLQSLRSTMARRARDLSLESHG